MIVKSTDSPTGVKGSQVIVKFAFAELPFLIDPRFILPEPIVIHDEKA